MRQCKSMRTVPDAELGAPYIVVEFAQALLAFIYSFVVVESADKRQIIAEWVSEAATGIVLIPNILQLAGVKAHRDVVVDLVITAAVPNPRRVDRAGIKCGKVIVQVAGTRLAHRMQSTTLQG